MSISFSENLDTSEIQNDRLWEEYAGVRPYSFREFIGQKDAVTCLKTYCRAARERKEALDEGLMEFEKNRSSCEKENRRLPRSKQRVRNMKRIEN